MRHLTLLALLLAPVAVHAEVADPAVARVEAYGVAVGGIARQGAALGFNARVAKFLPVVREYYDLPASLALIAGPAWASATAADKAAAIDAFARNSAIQHADNFKTPGFVLKADPATKARGSDRLVRARIGDETLVYRLRMSGGAWRIIDVQARGVSQLAVQKADLAGTVSAGGVKALAAKLTELNARPR